MLGWGYTPTSEHQLRLHEIVLAGGEDVAIGDEEILCDVGVGDANEKLVPYSEGDKRAVLGSPSVKGKLRVLDQICEATCGGCK